MKNTPGNHARYSSTGGGGPQTNLSIRNMQTSSPTNGGGAGNKGIDINTVNLNINELYKQYQKKPGSSLGGGYSTNFNNTT